MQTTNFSLGELLRRSKDGKLRIPQFQRDFVWTPSQVKLLIDSMSRSYPIGSLLLMDKTENLVLWSRDIAAQIRNEVDVCGGDPNASEKDTISYILDGQQRTTSIARVFLDADPKICYYFDLKAMFEKHHTVEETSWIKALRRGKMSPDRKSRNKLLRADIILDQKRADVYVSEYVEDSGDFPEFENDKQKARQASALIKGIFETVRNYKIPVVTLERSSNVESVCRVFETINSTGTRLTTFDLAVARFYPDPDLRKLWRETLDKYATIRDFDSAGQRSTRSGIDGEQILQVLYMFVASRSGRRSPEPTRGNLLDLKRMLPADDITTNWDRAASALSKTYDWARAQGARPETVPSRSILVAMAAIRCLHGDSYTGEVWQDHEFIRRWYFSKIMQSGASKASNYRIGLDFGSLREYVENGTLPDVEEVKLDIGGVMRLKTSDVRYKSLQNIFATTIRQDLVTGDSISSKSELHDHHIYPKILGSRESLEVKMLDSICNRVPILDKSNQTLGDEYPEIYFGELAQQARRQGTLEGFARRLRDCVIPGDPRDETWAEIFSVSKFDEFCQQRARLIIERVREIVGDSLRESSINEDDISDYEE